MRVVVAEPPLGPPRDTMTKGPNIVTRRQRRATAGLLAALCALVVGAPAQAAPADPADPVHAGDLLIDNYGFESGLTGWQAGDVDGGKVSAPSDRCADAATVSTDRHASGTASLKLTTSAGCRVVGAMSTAVPVSPGQRYTAFASASGDRGSATLTLVFTDAAGHITNVAPGSPGTAGTGDWGQVRVDGVAAPKAARVAVIAAADPQHTGTVYVDDVLITARHTDLGVQMSRASVNASTFGADGTAYTVVVGSDTYAAHLIGIDAGTGKVTVNKELVGAMGAWGATTATDGSVYVGSYNYDDPAYGSRLYRYTPGTGEVTDLGQPIAGDQFVWGLTAGPDGAVYGGGYPSGAAFAYRPGTGFTPIGGGTALAPPEQYGHAAAYDPTLDMAYVGIGAHAHLMACPHAGATCTDVLPAEFASEEFVYSLSAGDGYAFANLAASGDGHLAVLKVTDDGTPAATLVTDIKGVKFPGATAPLNGKVYYWSTNGRLNSYELATGAVQKYDLAKPTVSIRRLQAVAGPDGTVLRAIGNTPAGPGVYTYNVDTGVSTTVMAQNAPATPTTIQSIQAGPDGKIYSSGYLIGGTAAYTPMRSDQDVQMTGLGQAEGQVTIGDTLYFGVYPGAIIYAYKPSQPWASGTNPHQVCSLTAADQDRPYGMVNADGKLYIGTMAAYGKFDGGLSVYDPATGQCSTQSNIVPDQTIASLTYLDGKVYGGSMIWGGFGSDPIASEAKLLVYDTATGTNNVVDLPDKGLRSVLGLTVGPDHRIWMVAEDHLLVYDPATGRFVHDQQIFPELNIRSTDRLDAYDAFLTTAGDGSVYGTIHNSYLFRIDPRTMAVTVVDRVNAHHLVPDAYGNLYYVRDNLDLARYVP
jgi:hypothetical protein